MHKRKPMDELSSIVIDLLKRLDNEIKPEIYKDKEEYYFSPELWLESPFRNYVKILRGLSETGCTEIINHYLIQIIRIVSRLAENTNTNNIDLNETNENNEENDENSTANSPTNDKNNNDNNDKADYLNDDPAIVYLTKKLLILCQFIKVLPKIINSDKINMNLRALISTNYIKSSLNFQTVLHLNSALSCASFGSSNVFLPDAKLLNKIPYFYHYAVDINTFTSVFSIIPDSFSRIHDHSIRKRIATDLYDWIFNFFRRYPDVHKQILTSENLEIHKFAQETFNELLKHKLNTESEHLPLCAAIMPMCIDMVKEAKSSKNKVFNNILHSLGNLKQKNDNQTISVIAGIIELMDACILTNNQDLFSMFQECVKDNKPKVDKWLFKENKKKPILQGWLFNDFLPRYAALEYSRTGSFS